MSIAAESALVERLRAQDASAIEVLMDRYSPRLYRVAFGITRNPIYLADTLLLLGVGLVSGITWFLPLALAAAFVTGKVAIDKEERWLTEKFGKRYRDYTKRVRRWI